LSSKDVDQLKVISICTQSGYAETIEPRKRSLGVRYPILVGNRTVLDAFGVSGLPTTFVIGKNWIVYRRYLGAGHQHELERDIRTLLSSSTAVVP
jgi:hypothetical protein